MAFSFARLLPMTSRETGGAMLWNYQTPDCWAAVMEPGYFDASDVLHIGDLILINAEMTTGMVTGIAVVMSRLPRDVVIGQLAAPVAHRTRIVETA